MLVFFTFGVFRVVIKKKKNARGSKTVLRILSLFSRQLAEHSPYYEMFKSQNKEVLFAYDAGDEVSLLALQQFKMKAIKSVESWTNIEGGGNSPPASMFLQYEIKAPVKLCTLGLVDKAPYLSFQELVCLHFIVFSYNSA